MFFISDKAFQAKLDKAIREKLTIEKGGLSLIEDAPAWKGGYVERQLVVSYDDMWGMYLRNEWIRSCVDKISKSVTNSKLFAAPISDDEDISPQTQERIAIVQALLDDPNTGLESWQDIRKEYLRDVLIYDAGALEIVYDQKGIPAEIYTLPGERIRMNVDEHGTFKDEKKAFILVGGTISGKSYPDVALQRKELIYMVNNPKSGSVYGLSPLESLYQTVASDLFATKYNSDFFKNNGEASGVLGAEGLSLEELKRFRSFWRQEIAGKNHKMAIVNGKVTWTPMNLSNRDMQFLEYQRWLLCKIMTVYGMQPIVLGIIDPTTGKLNSEEQMKAYREETVRPLLELETYQLTKVLVQQGFGFDDVKIDYEAIDIQNELVNSQIAVSSVSAGILTPNEARRIYFQLPEIEGGDELRGIATPASLEAMPEEANPATGKEPKPKERVSSKEPTGPGATKQPAEIEAAKQPANSPKQPAEVAASGSPTKAEKVYELLARVATVLKKLETPNEPIHK